MMNRTIGTAVAPVLSFLVFAVLGFAQAPTIANITNAAIPAIDLPPDPSIPVQLAPRSIATIFGNRLSDSTVSAVPPWPNTLSGTEVHLVVNPTQYSCNPCEQPAGLLYVSPTQINFVVPDNLGVNGPRSGFRARVVLIKGGVRYDNHDDVFGGSGLIDVNSSDITDLAVFGVGYECLYSFSLTDPTSCGVSWSQGQHRAALGAVTDASGQLITSQNPVRQGEVIILWMTGLTGLSRDPGTGLLQLAHPGPVGFGVAQAGKDVPATVYNDSFDGFGYVGQWATPPALFAGESPQFVGLDQVNVTFPVCTVNTKAKTDQQFDAFLTFGSIVTATAVRIYVPFVVRAGDPDCQSLWGSTTTTPTGPSGTTTTLTSSPNPSVVGQAVTFTASVSPSAATGTVTFLDGGATLGAGLLSNGKAVFSTLSLSAGNHLISVAYSGDNSHGASTSSVLAQSVNPALKTTTFATLTSSLNPSNVGQEVTFTARVSPSAATGTVTFIDGSATVGAATLNVGVATFSTSALAVGSHSITAAYSGDTNYGGTSSVLVQTVNPATKASTITMLNSSPNPSSVGQTVTFTTTVAPAAATGTVSFLDGGVALGSGTLNNGAVTVSSSTLAAGVHSITATYNGDSNFGGSSTSLVQTVTKSSTTTTLTSAPNPSTFGQSVTFTATVSPITASGTVTFSDFTCSPAPCNMQPVALGSGTLSAGRASFSSSTLPGGSRLVTATYNGDTINSSSTSATLTQVVNKLPSTMTMSSSPNPSIAAQPVTFTATVSPSSATGLVTFADASGGGSCAASLSSGRAQCSVTSFSRGPSNYSITATYSGDTNYSGSTASAVQTVKQPTGTVLTSSPNPSFAGQLVTFSALIAFSDVTGP